MTKPTHSARPQIMATTRFHSSLLNQRNVAETLQNLDRRTKVAPTGGLYRLGFLGVIIP